MNRTVLQSLLLGHDITILSIYCHCEHVSIKTYIEREINFSSYGVACHRPKQSQSEKWKNKQTTIKYLDEEVQNC